jgi:hypothetical protein
MGKLDHITKLLPDAAFFILMYQHKDAGPSTISTGNVAFSTDAASGIGGCC